jgi:RNA polymerase sigma-54 factor
MRWVLNGSTDDLLKHFFTGKSWDKFRLKLQDIVDNEVKSQPLSDDTIVEEMDKHGYILTRRAVTKYRNVMDIPSSWQRREH